MKIHIKESGGCNVIIRWGWILENNYKDDILERVQYNGGFYNMPNLYI